MLRFSPVFRVLLLAVILLDLAACAPAAAPLPVSTPAPAAASSPTPGPRIDFSLVDLSGSPVKVSDYAGQVILLNFWASWCSPCKEEMPVLQQYYLDHQADKFVILAVNAGDSPADAARFIQQNGYTFPVWSDPAGSQLIKLGVNGLPFTMLLDREGRRVSRWYGGSDRATLDKIVTPLLSE